MKVGEFFVELGIDGKSANMTLGDVLGKMAGMRLSTLGAIDALYKFGNFWKDSTFFTENAAVAFTNFNNQTGLGVDHLQKWQLAGKQVNVSADAIAASMSRVQQKLLDVKLYGKGFEPFAMLGTIPSDFRDVDAMFERLSKVAQTMDPALFLKFATQIGIEPILINLLKLTPQQRKSSQITEGLSSSDIAMGMEFNRQMNEFKTQWMQFMYFMGTSVFPFFITELRAINTIFGSTWKERGLAVAGGIKEVAVGTIKTLGQSLTAPTKQINQISLFAPAGSGRTHEDLPNIVDLINKAMFGEADLNHPTQESNSPSADPVKETRTP